MLRQGFYYLNSRYYDPQVGRFINADGYVSTGVGTNGYNMFAYCNNNPVNMEDSEGCRPIYSIDENENIKYQKEVVTNGTPPTKEDGYIPKNGKPTKTKNHNGNKKGWEDKNGNIWIPVPDGHPQAHGGGHWDVQRGDGKGYVNRYPGGYQRKGAGKEPVFPAISDNWSDSLFQFPAINFDVVANDTVIVVGIIIGITYFAYTGDPTVFQQAIR